MDNIKSIINEILSDIQQEQPKQASTTYKAGEVQIRFDNYNYSSYCVESEEYEIIKENLNKLVLK